MHRLRTSIVDIGLKFSVALWHFYKKIGIVQVVLYLGISRF